MQKRQTQKLQRRKQHEAVERQRREQHAEHPDALAEDLPGAFLRAAEQDEHADDAEACRDGKIALVNAARKADEQGRCDPAALFLRRENP